MPSANVDLCAACGGLWVDWFDGAVHTLASEAAAVRVDREAPSPSASAEKVPGAQTCPRCHQRLQPELYRFPDAAPGELVGDVELLRCSECLGSFVPRSSAYLLLDRTLAPRPATIREVLGQILARLLDLIRGTETASRG